MSGVRSCALLLTMTSCCHASLITIGPNGINSQGLFDADGELLDGTGIAIGQVEPHRPGDAQVGDSPMFRNSTIDPNAVFVRDGAPIPNDAGTIDNHASWVAGVMISSDTTRRGVAPSAQLYASAFDPAAPFFDEQAALSAQHIALQNSGDVRAINMSFVIPLDSPEHVRDGNQLLTQFVDWSASNDNVLYVVAGKNTTNPAGFSIPAENFNGLTVAATARVGGVYSRVATINDFSEDATGLRTSVSLLAPGDDVEVAGLNNLGSIEDGRSIAAAHVTGTVALLQQYADERIDASAVGWTGTFETQPTAHRHEVMKAVLMNSADKLIDDGTFAPEGSLLGMERTVLDQQGNNWLVSEANDDSTLTGAGDIPLDDQMGAGHLNAKRALQQFLPGEFDSDGADVPSIGWDYGMTSGEDDTNVYHFGEELQAGSYISLTLAWDRVVEFDTDGGTLGMYDIGDTFEEYTETDPYADDVINDLDLKLYGPTFLEAQSISLEGTLEHIFFEIPVTGNYRFEVEQFDADVGTQNYAVAWWYGLAPELEVPISGDFDGDNDVDGDDLTIWESAYAVNDSGDADGDGDSDGDDFLIWQRNYGAGVLSAATAVPEPGAGLLAMIGLVLAARRHA